MSDSNNQSEIARLSAAFVEITKVPGATAKNAAIVVEIVKDISDLLAYMKKKDDSYFELLRDNRVLDHMQRFLAGGIDEVDIQILKTCSMLMQNTTVVTQLYYVMSQPALNAIVSHNYRFENETVTSEYTAFVKGITIRLNSDSIIFFYHEGNDRLRKFPIYLRAIELFNYPNSMVRAEAGLITLRLYKHKLDKLNKVMATLPLVLHFGKVACKLGQVWLSMTNPKDGETLKGSIEESEIRLLYIHDAIENNPFIAETITNALLYFAVFPIVIHALKLDPEHCYISEKLALLLLRQILNIIPYCPLIRAIFAVLTFRTIPAEWQSAINDFPMYVPGFSRDWKLPHCDDEVEYVKRNFNYDLGTFLDPTQPFLQKIAQDFQQERAVFNGEEAKEKAGIEGLNKKYLAQIKAQIGVKKMEEIEKEHKRLSFAFGFPVGLVPNSAKSSSILSLSALCFTSLAAGKPLSQKEGGINLVPNPAFGAINKLLSSKDDTHLLQTSSLLFAALNFAPGPELDKEDPRDKVMRVYSLMKGVVGEDGIPKTPDLVQDVSGLGSAVCGVLLQALDRDSSPPLRFLTSERILTLLCNILEITKCGLSGPNEIILTRIHNRLLENCKAICKTLTKKKKGPSIMLNFFANQWKFIKEFRTLEHGSDKSSVYKALLSPVLILGSVQGAGFCRPEVAQLLCVPSEEMEATTQYVRTFFTLRLALPKVWPGRFPGGNDEEFPLVRPSRADCVIIMARLVRDEGIGYPCFELARCQVLSFRYVILSQLHLIVMEPDLSGVTTTAKVIHELTYSSLKAKINPEDPRKLRLNSKSGKHGKKIVKTVELFFEEEDQARNLASRVDESRQKAVLIGVSLVDTYMAGCEIK